VRRHPKTGIFYRLVRRYATMTGSYIRNMLKITDSNKWLWRIFFGLGFALLLVRSLAFQVFREQQINIRTETFFNLTIYTWGWLAIAGAIVALLSGVVLYLRSRGLHREDA
jgi:hypothetical protein